ncbi:MAG: hypothetical protein OXE78_03620 [Gammaproteobacteria bacterium]|nr:hypothetical protein [Gammaproteobacteria bacterium]MCY4356362.1 hypothetical protein [Gammaproteobacteria bacterium]
MFRKLSALKPKRSPRACSEWARFRGTQYGCIPALYLSMIAVDLNWQGGSNLAFDTGGWALNVTVEHKLVKA